VKLNRSLRPLAAICGLAIVSISPARADDATAAGVKKYLLATVDKMKAASADFARASAGYADLIQKAGGSVQAAYVAQPKEIDQLVERMREDYKKMDSFGYETVEGIVAGVPSMVAYDVYLDSGVPTSKGPENVAPVVLDLGNGQTIDHQGCLFTYIIEPALWAGDKRWVTTVKSGDKEAYLPRPEVVVAAGREVDKKIGELQADAREWGASVEDCFGAMVVMTPTFSGYFDDWKESLAADKKVRLFQAVSRVSDMRGIMGSCGVMYDAVEARVAEKDKALAKAVGMGFRDITRFIDLIEKREKSGDLKAAEIDELGAQAKEKTDKLVPQIEQSAAVAGIKVQG